MLDLFIEDDTGARALCFRPLKLIIAGWTGRDSAALEAHIEELEALGVARPKSVPIFYRVDASLLTTSETIQCVGREASGEVEAVLYKHDGEYFVGVGSDHTDRKLETVGITLSKQVGAKPVSQRVWRWEDVAGHWDSLLLRSCLPQTGEIYQEGSTANLRRPDDLIALYEELEGPLPDGTAIFCGTLAVRGGIRFNSQMALELVDPVRERSLSHHYMVEDLPVVEA